MIRLKLNRFLILLACIGVALYLGINMLYGLQSEEAAPAESPSISKEQAAEAAVQFLKNRYGIEHAHTFVVYQSQKVRSGYLQKEKLSELYEQKYGDRFPLDFYQVSVVDRETKRSFTVDVNYSSKQVIGWIESAGAEARIDKDAAQAQADKEMIAQGWNPEDFTSVPQPEDSRSLLFEKRADSIGASKLQLQMTFQGAEVIGYHVLFTIPEEHEKWLETQDGSASTMTWISLGSTLLMTLAALVYVIRYRKALDFRKGVLLTVIYTTIYIVNNINMYPAFKSMSGALDAGFATLFALLFMNAVTLLLGVSLYLSLAAGDGLWRASGWQPWPSWREERFGREVYHGMGRGYLIALFILGIQQVLFYVGEQNFDIWAVNDPSDSVLNMLTPGLFPLMAWVAGISEEATYRLLGIVLVKKLTRSNFLAILLPSLVWAASHTQYPIYPVYTRLVEVTVIGIILGYVFLKYGFITALFAHACMDSILMGMSLFSLNTPADVLTGLFYIVLPALIGLFLAWLHGKRRRPLIPGEPPPHLEAL